LYWAFMLMSMPPLFIQVPLKGWNAILTGNEVTLMSVWCLHSSVYKAYLHIDPSSSVQSHILLLLHITLVAVFQICDVVKFRGHTYLLRIEQGTQKAELHIPIYLTISLE
ncbi:hypothetical protein BAE44_0000478, partial [Dichanthelium oligosanthes]